jgi:ParB/RepB/Spo0J family partition protein
MDNQTQSAQVNGSAIPEVVNGAAKEEAKQVKQVKHAKRNATSFRGFLEANSSTVKRADIALRIPMSKIKVREGFNPRDLQKVETQAKIEGLVEAYGLGHYVKPIEVVPKGEFVEIVDGECRYTAAAKAGVKALDCVVVKGDEAKLLVMTVTGNEGERLTAIEQADVVKRLLDMGKTREEIRQEFACTIGWIDRLIVLTKLPDEAKQMVREGKVSADAAHDTWRSLKANEKDQIVGKLKELVSAKGDGDKVTKKDVAKEKKPKGDSDGSGESEGEKAPSANKVRKDTTLELMPELANNLPDFGITKSKIKMTEVYKVALTGKVLKHLLAIQQMWADEPEEEADE